MPSERVKEFYDYETFAIIGMSQSKDNFAWAIYKELVSQGKRVYPIHPRGGKYRGVQFYASFRELPDPAEGVIVSADLRKTRGLLDELKNSGARAIWFQQGCYDQKVLAQANVLGLDPIKGCAFMYLPGAPVFHRFHRAINDLFGKGYK